MPTIREYLVSLGAEVDNKSFGKFNAALKGAGKTVLGFGAAIAALMTMVAKTSISLDKTTQSYEKMAKEQHKTTEEIRAQQTALKIMGKTLKEVNASKELKAQYDELKKIGKEMQLPGVGAGEKSLRGFLQDIEKLRMVSTYALNMINHEFLAKIRAPLEQVRKRLNGFTERLKYEMPRIVSTVSGFFSGLFRLAMAGVQGIADLIGKFDKLPDSIKLAGEALLVAFGLSKLGPVALLIGGITTILLLLEDYQTWLRGGDAALGKLWESMKDGTAVEFLKGKLGEVTGKVEEVEKKLAEWANGLFTMGEGAARKVLEGLQSHDWAEDGVLISSFFGKLVDALGAFIADTNGKATTFFASISAVAGAIIEGLATSLGTAVATFDWTNFFTTLIQGADSLLNIVQGILFGTKDEQGNQQYKGLIDSIQSAARDLVTNFFIAVMGIDAEKIATSIGNFSEHFAEVFGQLLDPQRISTAMDTLGTFAEAGLTLAKKVFEIITQSVSKIKFSEVGATVGTAVNTILKKFTEWMGIAKITLPDTFREGVAAAKGVARGLIDMLGSAFKQIEPGSIKDAIGSMLTVIVTLIGEAFSETNVADFMDILKNVGSLAVDAALGLAEAILGAFAEVPYDKVAGDIGAAVNTVFAKIGEFFTKASEDQDKKSFSERFGDLAGLAINIANGMVNAIGEGFGKIDLNNVTDAISSVINSFFGLIGQVFSDQNIEGAGTVLQSIANVGITMATGLMNAIADSIGKVDLKGTSSSISNAIKNLFTQITAFLSTMTEKDPKTGKSPVENMGDSFLNMGKAIVQGLADSFSGLDLTNIGGVIGTMINKVFELIGQVFSKENVAGAMDIVNQLREVGLNLAISLMDGIAQAFGQLELGHVSGDITTVVNTIFDKIVEGLDALMKPDEEGNSLVTKLSGSFVNMAKAVFGGLAGAVTSLTSSDSDISANIGTIGNKLLSLLDEIFTPENVSAVLGSVMDLAGAALNLATGLMGGLADAFGKIEFAKVTDDVSTLVTSIFSKIGEFLSTQIEKDGESGESAAGKMGAALVNVGKAIVGGIGSAISGFAFTDVSTELSGVLEKVISFFGEIFSKENVGGAVEVATGFATAAINLITGLFSAIATTIGTVPFDKISGDVSTIITTIFDKIGEGFTTMTTKGEDGKSMIEKLGESMAGVGLGIVEGIKGAVSGIQWNQITPAISGMLNHLFEIFGQVFSPDNTAAAAGILTGLADAGINLGIGLMNAIGDTLTSVQFGDVTASIGAGLKSFMDKIAEYLGKLLEKDETTGKTFGDRLGDSLSGIGEGIVNALGGAFNGLGIDGLAGSLGNIVSKLFSLIADVFKPKNIEKISKVGLDILSIGGNVAREVLRSISNAFQQIPVADIGTNLGGGIKALFTSVSTWLEEQIGKNENGESVLGMAGKAIYDAASSVVSTIGTALNELLQGDEVAKFGEKLSGFITSALDDVFDRLTTDDPARKIDLSKIGADIGSAIGNLIKIGVQFITSFISDFGEWYDGGGKDQLAEIGKQIMAGIVSGLGSIYDIIMMSIFGEDYTKGKETATAMENVYTGTTGAVDENGRSLTTAEQMELRETNPEAYAAAVARSAGSSTSFEAQKKAIDEYFGFKTTQWTLFGGDNSPVWIADYGHETAKELGINTFGLGNMGKRNELTKYGQMMQAALDNADIQSYFMYAQKMYSVLNQFDPSKAPSKTNSLIEILGGGEGAATGLQNAAGDLSGSAEALTNAAEVIEQTVTGPETGNGAGGISLPGSFEEQKDLVNRFFGFTTKDSTGKPTFGSSYGDNTYITRKGSWDSEKNAFRHLDDNSYQRAANIGFKMDSAQTIEEYIYLALQLDKLLSEVGAKKPETEVTVDTSDAMRNVEALIATINSIPPVTTPGGETQNALGGRFSTATRGVFGEDGTEYIIPITKPGRAKALILQMFREMGAGASSILTELGVSAGGPAMGGPGMGWTSQPAAMYPQAGGSMKNNSDNTVSVPTTINVYGSGDALMAGQAAARASQSNVLRSVRGVLGA